jgi:hypothetical protein
MPNNSSANALDQGYGTVALTALAATAGLPGAADAWNGFVAANYAVGGWSADPKWAILPRSGAGGAPAACIPTSTAP